MLAIFNGLRNISFLTTLFRMLFACLAGAAVGLERSYRNRPAGFRTHILVCLGACIASLTGLYLYLEMGLPTDMSRIGAQVITGISFVGAGTIYVTKKNTVKGLTTAAGLWVSAVVGLAIGAGFYEGGIIGVVLILLTETVFHRINEGIKHIPEAQFAVSYAHRHDLDNVLRFLKDNNCSIVNLQVSGYQNEEMIMHNAIIVTRPHNEINEEDFIKQISAMDGIYSAVSV